MHTMYVNYAAVLVILSLKGLHDAIRDNNWADLFRALESLGKMIRTAKCSLQVGQEKCDCSGQLC